jgi:hypothetical protein
VTYKTNILDVLEEDGNVRFELDVKKKKGFTFISRSLSFQRGRGC